MDEVYIQRGHEAPHTGQGLVQGKAMRCQSIHILQDKTVQIETNTTFNILRKQEQQPYITFLH
jgi:hypothetical protein